MLLRVSRWWLSVFQFRRVHLAMPLIIVVLFCAHQSSLQFHKSNLMSTIGEQLSELLNKTITPNGPLVKRGFDNEKTASPLELRYKIRNDRIKKVCQERVITHEAVFITNKNFSIALYNNENSTINRSSGRPIYLT